MKCKVAFLKKVVGGFAFLCLCGATLWAQGPCGGKPCPTEKNSEPPAVKSPAREPAINRPALNAATAQGPNEIQTHGNVCADPARPCSAGGVFSDSDLSFALPAKVEWQRNYYSANFYAIILKSKPVVSDDTPDTDNCQRGFFPADERRAAQSLFPGRKVFASEFGCYLVKIGYTNTNYKYNFLAVYAGENQAQAQITLREVKATGKFPGANVRRMQVVFQNGD